MGKGKGKGKGNQIQMDKGNPGRGKGNQIQMDKDNPGKDILGKEYPANAHAVAVMSRTDPWTVMMLGTTQKFAHKPKSKLLNALCRMQPRKSRP